MKVVAGVGSEGSAGGGVALQSGAASGGVSGPVAVGSASGWSSGAVDLVSGSASDATSGSVGVSSGDAAGAHGVWALQSHSERMELVLQIGALYEELLEAARAKDEPTVPTQLSRELETNPFLRADTPEMRERWGGETPADTFAKLRAAKDSF